MRADFARLRRDAGFNEARSEDREIALRDGHKARQRPRFNEARSEDREIVEMLAGVMDHFFASMRPGPKTGK